MQPVSTCFRLVPNLFLKHKSMHVIVSFALSRGEIKALHANTDILKTGQDTP